MAISEQQGGFVAEIVFSHPSKIDLMCEARTLARSPARAYS